MLRPNAHGLFLKRRTANFRRFTCSLTQSTGRSRLPVWAAQTQLAFPVQVLDLSGDREPLTKETAEDALAPLLAANASITTVSKCTADFAGYFKVSPDICVLHFLFWHHRGWL